MDAYKVVLEGKKLSIDENPFQKRSMQSHQSRNYRGKD